MPTIFSNAKVQGSDFPRRSIWLHKKKKKRGEVGSGPLEGFQMYICLHVQSMVTPLWFD